MPVVSERKLPDHRRRSGATVAVRANDYAVIEEPHRFWHTVTWAVRKNTRGRYELQVQGAVLKALEVRSERLRGGVLKIRTAPLQEIWNRYGQGDYGRGRAGLALYADVAGADGKRYRLALIDDAMLENPELDPAESPGPQRLVLVPDRD